MALLHVAVYRDLSNRSLGESDNGPTAWTAHRARLAVLEDAFADDAFVVRDWSGADDETTTHEFVDVVVEVIKNPTATAVGAAAGIAVLKLLAKPLEKKLEAAVERVFGKLFSAFRKKEIGDFSITLPDGTVLRCPPGTTIEVKVPGEDAPRIVQAPE